MNIHKAMRLTWCEFFRKWFDVDTQPVGMSDFKFRAMKELVASHFGSSIAQSFAECFDKDEDDGLYYTSNSVSDVFLTSMQAQGEVR